MQLSDPRSRHFSNNRKRGEAMALKLYEYPEAYRDLWNRIESEVDGSGDADESPADATR